MIELQAVRFVVVDQLRVDDSQTDVANPATRERIIGLLDRKRQEIRGFAEIMIGRRHARKGDDVAIGERQNEPVVMVVWGPPSGAAIYLTTRTFTVPSDPISLFTTTC